MARALKVYRTPIGFHDAYVAAPSQKAALEAWGTDANLFARGMAELVTDEALSREPLENAGKVIRRPRGTTAEHLAALPPDEPDARSKSKVSAKRSESRSTSAERRAKAAPKPKPSRAALEEAEALLEQLLARQEDETAAVRQKEKALQRERAVIETQHERDTDKLEASLAKERQRYEAALRKWQG